jgi:O-antigen/teichoic acid export membrane protein
LHDDTDRTIEVEQRPSGPGGTLLGAFGVMMVSFTIASALAYLFSIIMTRMLGKAGAFSNFNSLNSLFLIIFAGSSAIQTVITKYVAETEAGGERDRIHLLVHVFSRWLIWTGAIILLTSAAVAWPLSHVLKLGSPGLVIVLGSYLASTLFLMLPYGLLQGEQRFAGLGGASISAAALRVVFGVGLVAAGLGVYGALGAGTLAGLCLIVVIVYYYRDLFTGKVEPAHDFHPARVLRAFIPVALAFFMLMLMTQIDVVIVKAIKGAVEADIYSYGALAGKAVLFFPMGISVVMFPRVSQLHARGKSTRKVLGLSLLSCIVLESAVVGFYVLFPDFTGMFFAGRHGREISRLTGALGAPFVVFFGLVMAVFAIVYLLVYYQIALNKRAFIAVLAVGAVAEVAGIALFHKTLPDVLLVMLVIGLVVMAANLLLSMTGTSSRNYDQDSD